MINNKNWNAIDLHLHTIGGITGDAKNETNAVKNFTYCNFFNSLRDVGISLCSITNHNYIHLPDYIICRYLAKKYGINILLGVELDIDDRSSEDYHMVCVFDCDLDKSLTLQKTINTKSQQAHDNGLNKLRFNSDDIGHLIEKYRVIMIPHSGHKSKHIPLNNQEDAKELFRKIKEGHLCILDERSSWDLGYLKSAIEDKEFYKYAKDIAAAFFSDNKDWTPGEYKKKCTRVTFMNSEPTFKGLAHSLTNPTERLAFENNIPVYSQYITRVEINNKSTGSLLATSTINLKPGFNCIIGKSGSGKSLLLHILEKFLNNVSSASEYEKYLNDDVEITLFDESNNVINPGAFNVAKGTPIFAKLVESIDSDNLEAMKKAILNIDRNYLVWKNFNAFKQEYSTNIISYFHLKQLFLDGQRTLMQSLNTFDGNYKKLLSLSNISNITIDGIPSKTSFKYTDKDIENITKYQDNIKQLKDILSLINDEEKTKDIFDDLNNLQNKFEKLFSEIILEKNKHVYKMKKIDVVTSALNELNKTTSSNAENKFTIETYFRNGTKNLAIELTNHYLLKKQISNYDLSVNVEKMNNISSLDGNDKIKVVEKINDEIFTKAHLKDRNVFNVFGLGITNDSEYDLSNKDDARSFFDAIFNSSKFVFDEETIKPKILPNVLPSLTLLFDGQDVKKLNSGDIAKIFLEHYFTFKLGTNNTVVLYDQLENDVDKEYIKTDLLKYISDLKNHLQLIVVTHDPIIAVNGDPVNYVIATKDSDRTIRYRDFVPESEERDELETLANTVDGSKQVIKDRYMVYKGENV